ncbi:lysine-specific demethylase 5A-like [Nilaparvata lugens]|uniref:lysine-specific demethylase 5A-like n=1 Tax=Nilaparvata lugens TaxID=108931 RepID=UPI00193DA4FC|nr:lysine-specific demethylase 5A-like [Nilaparvata lugens]
MGETPGTDVGQETESRVARRPRGNLATPSSVEGPSKKARSRTHETAFPISLGTSFRIITSSQHLNKIDAVLRSREIFLGRLTKFFELRGLVLKTPVLECRKVDLHSLHHAVARQGGYCKVSEQNKWVEVAKELHYKDIEPMALALQEHYKKLYSHM